MFRQRLRSVALLGQVFVIGGEGALASPATLSDTGVIELGPGGYSAPLTMLVVATAAYGILAGGTALDDIINLRGDMDDAMKQTSYGQGITARNIPALKMISASPSLSGAKVKAPPHL